MPFVDIRGVNLHYHVVGERGPWLALITGGRRGFNEFVPLAEKIAAHGIRVLLHVSVSDERRLQPVYLGRASDLRPDLIAANAIAESAPPMAHARLHRR